jgi:hypothetical protein
VGGHWADVKTIGSVSSPRGGQTNHIHFHICL